MHKKYGEVVRLAPDRLSFVTAGAWRDIAGTSVGKRLENRKDLSAIPSNIKGIRSLASEHRSEVHRPRRRIYQNAFSDKALKKQEPLILGYVNLLVKVIKEAGTNDSISKVDIQKLLNCCTFDVMADLTFGEPLGLLEQSELSPWVAQIFGNIRIGSIKRVSLEYPIMEHLIKAITPKSLKAAAMTHYDYSALRVEKRLAKGVDIGKPDIWSLVMTKNEQNEIPKEIMMADAMTFMIAGTETTASTLSVLFYLCLTHPEQMQRLQAEVRALREDELTLDTLHHLPFMTACLKESLRVHPVVPIPIFRKTPQGGNAIDGQWIPENVSKICGKSETGLFASVLTYVTTKIRLASQSLNSQPTTTAPTSKTQIPSFLSAGSLALATIATTKTLSNPSRLDRATVSGKSKFSRKSVKTRMRGGFFSLTPIHYSLANHEMRIILAKLLWNFDFELCEESRSWINQKVYLLWDKPPLIVKARYIRG